MYPRDATLYRLLQSFARTLAEPCEQSRKRPEMYLDRSHNLCGSSLEAAADETASGSPASGKPAVSKGASSFERDAVNPHERPRRIARIREAVAQGSYEVSASDLAGKLIDHMLGR